MAGATRRAQLCGVWGQPCRGRRSPSNVIPSVGETGEFHPPGQNTASLFMFRLRSEAHLSAKQITGAEENPRSRANAEEKGKPDSPTCPSDSCPYVEHLEAVANASSGFYLKYASKLGVLRNERSWWSAAAGALLQTTSLFPITALPTAVTGTIRIIILVIA